MGKLQFVSSIISAIAWPVATIIIVLILKEPVKYLIGSIEKLKYKGLEVEFNNLKNMSKLIPKIEKTKEISINERVIYSSLETQIADIAPRSPESAIFISWAALELAISEAVNRLRISPDSPSYRSVMHNIDCLENNSKLDRNTLNAIGALRALRNTIAHGGRANIEQALNYEKTTTSVIKVLQNVEGK